MTTTPERKTPEQVVTDALVMTDLTDYAGTDMGMINQAVGSVIAALRAAGLLVGDPTEEPTREQRTRLGWAIVGALKQCGISVTYALSGPAEMFDLAGIVLREYPALAAAAAQRAARAAAGVASQEPSAHVNPVAMSGECAKN